ncbi:MAG: NUDIX domain-containing protein [Planctomycetota bacterium]|nr:NUDIX domain-containing protein [Planctomycetota bacterium]
MKRKKTACGFVLVREQDGAIEYLLLTNRERQEPGLPKGHAEKDEPELETALRETEEETGLTDLEVADRFRRELIYPATRKGQTYEKTVVYFLARLGSGEVRLSKEHSEYEWAPLERALYALPFPNLRNVVREAALWLKDRALFELEPWDEADAENWIAAQVGVTDHLLGHLRGGARLARVFARELEKVGVDVNVEATAAGTMLHDAGRALGAHDDHPRAGLLALRRTPLAPYAFACVSHFTKGASVDELVETGVDRAMLDEVGALVDLERMTWEERCAALADACMRGTEVVSPAVRFADLRRRYDHAQVIDLQALYTERARKELEAALGQDPLQLIGLGPR